VLLTAAILIPVLLRGWYPHDEGALGQAAERVLHGEVPHRDFDEIYTGLLTYWHALAFRLGGVASSTLRWPLFGLALGWAALLHRVAMRAMPGWAALLVVGASVLWSVPNYPAPMPSWYNLFFATAGLYALVRWRETDRAHWALLAGLAGGLSFLVKLSGVAFVIGAGLVLVLGTIDRGRGRSGRGGFVVVAAGLLTVLAVLWRPLAAADPRVLARLWLPLALLCVGVLVAEWRSPVRTADRVRALRQAFVPFLTGAAVPVLLWGVYLATVGALDDTLRAVFVTSFRRVDSAAVLPPTLDHLLGTAIVALALIPRAPRAAWLAAAAVAAAGGALLLQSGSSYAAYRGLWFVAWGLPILAAGWAVALLIAPTLRREPTTDLALTVTCVAIAILLVEFPFAAPIYTLYALPLTLLALAMLVRVGAPPAPPALVVLGLLIAVGALRLYPGGVPRLGFHFAVTPDSVPFAHPRSGLRMSPDDVSQYTALLGSIEELAPGRTLWAGPDAPEVYFLSGVPNRTRTMFDFLDDSPTATLPLAARVHRAGATLVVINTAPSFSARPREDELALLRARYPHERTHPGFVVLWQ
jgi:hypothetical protein